jgi:hypothetical protein
MQENYNFPYPHLKRDISNEFGILDEDMAMSSNVEPFEGENTISGSVKKETRIHKQIS